MMNLYWKWEQAIPKEVCELIKKEFSEDDKNAAQVRKHTGGVVDHKARKSDVCWLRPNHWVEGTLFNHVRYANQSAGWNFDVQQIEQIQLTRYRKDEFYDWHDDESVLSRSDFPRKLSVVLLLSDPSEYEGGGLFIKDVPDNLLQKQGDLVVFPSMLIHKAETVTIGTRMTAVGWTRGPKFR